jgi:fructose-bisphosphate aldolase class II
MMFDPVLNALQAKTAVPAFNVPYLPMVEPVVRAVVDLDSFALIESARLEWVKFEAKSAAAVAAEFARHPAPDHVRLHLDHVPVIDEDDQRVDYLADIQTALNLGYQSVMIDGSRLSLEENIAATKKVAAMAYQAGIPCEAELGAVLGHAAGLLPPYEELFASGRGFTRVDEARRFVQETGCDWLSVAVGNIHGAIAAGAKDKKKIAARLDLDHLQRLYRATAIPLVLHGGSGIPREYVLASFERGIAKINIATEIRQAYEQALAVSGDITAAQAAVYERTTWLIDDFFGLGGTRRLINNSSAVSGRLSAGH